MSEPAPPTPPPSPTTRAAVDGHGQPIEVVPLAALGEYVLASPVAAPAVTVLYRAPGEADQPLRPVTDEAELRAAADHLLGQSLLPGAPVTLETPDGELTLHRLLTLEVDGTSYDVMARAPGDRRALVFARQGDDLSLVQDPAVVRRVQERAAATVSAFVGAAPEATPAASHRADDEVGEDAPPSLVEGQALLAELERLLDEVPPAYHPGAEYQRLARMARELREGLDRLRGAGPA